MRSAAPATVSATRLLLTSHRAADAAALAAHVLDLVRAVTRTGVVLLGRANALGALVGSAAIGLDAPLALMLRFTAALTLRRVLLLVAIRLRGIRARGLTRALGGEGLIGAADVA